MEIRENFKNIKGQDAVCKLLSSQLDNNKISHAYLFTGPSGAGKLDVAKAFVKSIFDKKFHDAIDHDTHPDVKILTPEGAHAYLVAQIKEVVNDSYLAPIQAQKKVYIITDVQDFNSASANAFLKTLEEPTDNVIFILTANDINNVLPTIVSRCQHIEFATISFETASLLVQKESGADVNQAKQALNIFGGDIKKACGFLLDQNFQDFYNDIVNVVSSIDELSDWSLLKRSKYIIERLDEIVQQEKSQLDDKLSDLKEVLEKSALSNIEDQNKRIIQQKKRELLAFVCSVAKYQFRNCLGDQNDDLKQIKRLNLLSELEQNIAYNINSQIFCDALLLNLKRM